MNYNLIQKILLKIEDEGKNCAQTQKIFNAERKKKRIYYYIIYEHEKEYCYCIRNER